MGPFDTKRQRALYENGIKTALTMAKGEKGFQPGNTCGAQTRFSREQQPRHRGRKKLIYSKVLNDKSNHIGKEEFNRLVRCILEMTVGQIQGLIKQSEQPDSGIPAWMVIVARALLADMRRGKINVLMFLMGHLFGKEPILFEAKIHDDSLRGLMFDCLTEDELETFLGLYSKMVDYTLNLHSAKAVIPGADRAAKTAAQGQEAGALSGEKREGQEPTD